MLFDQVSKDIIAAMKAHDKVALETLRNIKKVFLEAKTAPGANDTLEDADALKLIQKLVKQGKDAAEIYTQQGRADLAEAELAQVKVMETYLPKPLSDEELTEAIKQIIAEQLSLSDPSKITMETSLIKDLEADSLDAVEIVLAIEEEYDIEIPDEVAETFTLVADLVKYVEEEI